MSLAWDKLDDAINQTKELRLQLECFQAMMLSFGAGGAFTAREINGFGLVLGILTDQLGRVETDLKGAQENLVAQAS